MSPELVGVLAWPTAVVVLGVAALLALRANFARLLDRTQQIGKTGLITHGPQQPVQPDSAADAAHELMAAFDNALLVQQEASIREDLRARGLEGKPESEKVLVRNLAATQLVLHFERAYASIFGTQIELLQVLNARSDGVTLAELRDAFSTYVTKRHKGTTFEEWAEYPGTLGFATLRDDRLHITDLGREFLKYLVETRKTAAGAG